jgi:hypothetical protein
MGPTVPARLISGGSLAAGQHAIDWDVTSSGAVLPDGNWDIVVEAATTLGLASHAVKVVVDTSAPVLRLVSAFKRLATVSEPATITTVVDGKIRTFVRRKPGLFRIPAPSSYRNARVAARDRAGNIARQLIIRRKPMRRIAARAGTAPRPATRRG